MLNSILHNNIFVKNRGTIAAAIVGIVLLAVYWMVSPSAVSTAGINNLVSATTMIAIAAVGEAIIVLLGGFDLSVASIIAVLNVLFVTQVHVSVGDEIGISLAVCVIGGVISLINGFIVVYARIPSIIVTLAASFVWGGVALLILPQPGGDIPGGYASLLTGFVGGVIPVSLIMILIAVVVWIVLKHTKLGLSWYTIGSNRQVAETNGIRVKQRIMVGYLVAGLLYGFSSLFLTAQSASGNPDVSDTVIITIFAAVVIGGVMFGGGKGDPAGAVLGAFILTLIIQVLFVLGVSSFYTDVLDGGILIVAVAVLGIQWRSIPSIPSIMRRRAKIVKDGLSELGYTPDDSRASRYSGLHGESSS